MTERIDPIADMISEGGPASIPEFTDGPITAAESLATKLGQLLVTLRPTDIPFGSAIVDKDPEQTTMVGEGGNAHGQY